MSQLRIAIATVVLLVGCAKNDLKLTNQGTNEWQQIEIKAGGQAFKINQLKGGATQTLRFKSKAEDGGEVSGKLHGQTNKAKFGYFTPNLSTKHEIFFTDNGTIKTAP